MKNVVKVKLQENGIIKEIEITDNDKPDISDSILEKWQNILNLITKIMHVPAGLIMKLDIDTIEVLVKNNNFPHPYEVGAKEHLCAGLFCETVLGNNTTLLVPNALKKPYWKTNPDVMLNMISYLGMPIIWPDRQHFGTICVLDNKENKYSEDFIDLLKLMRSAIETDLNIVMKNDSLKKLSITDQLTNLYNRTHIIEVLNKEFERFKRYNLDFSLMLIDIDGFKSINDNLGHLAGDKILHEFANILLNNIRKVDVLGRWGGEEFIIICPKTDLTNCKILANKLLTLIREHNYSEEVTVTASIGITTTSSHIENYNDLINTSDQALYQAKNKGKNRIECC
jgi:diguanylate cyclase (GGDEF)-like protein